VRQSALEDFQGPRQRKSRALKSGRAKERVHVRLDRELLVKAMAARMKAGVSLSGLMEQSLGGYLLFLETPSMPEYSPEVR
jgi:hypothetical protein